MAEAKVTLSAVDQTKAAIESAQRNLKGLGDQASRVSGLMGSIGVAIGAAFSAGSIMHLVEMLDALDKMSEKTGITVESLSALRYAGEIADVTQEKMGTGLRKLAKIMAEAAGGNDQAALTFKTLGIAVTNADGSLRKTDEVLMDVAQQFKGWEDGPAKAAIAMKIFGKSGDDMIPMLNMGKVGLQSMGAEAQALGAVYAGDVSKNAAEFNDNLKRIKMASEAAAISLTSSLVSALGDVSSAFITAKKNGEGYLGIMSRMADLMPEIPDEIGGNSLLTTIRAFQKNAKALDAPKSTADIQSYVNKLGFGSGGAGRGWVNPKVAAPVITDKTGNKPADHFADNFINQLTTEYANLSGQMSKSEEVTRKLDTATEKFSATDRSRALTLAGLIDKEKDRSKLLENVTKYSLELEKILQEQEDTYSSYTIGVLHANKALEFEVTLLGKNAIEIEKARHERELSLSVSRAEAQVYEQQALGLLSVEEARRRINQINNGGNANRNAFGLLQTDQLDQQNNPGRGVADGIKQYLDEVAKAGEFTKNSVVGAFASMEDALVNFVKTGKLDFSSLADSIISDMARMSIRKFITAPMAAAFGFADGGVMSSAGPVPLRAYAGGGIADRPQLALFGEGRMNEAFVPLPDGRSIPVSMKGGGQAVNITINASVGDIASKSDVVAGMRATANNIVAQISRSRTYGGALA